MGFAIAEQLASRGVRVILICGPVELTTQHPLIHRIDVISADEMYDACMQHFPQCQGAVMTAAVSDYSPVLTSGEKIKRTEGNLLLELRPNRDIAAEFGRIKRADQLLVGFALETENEMDNALSKLKRKNLDLIVLNSMKDAGAGFGHDTNKITILTRDGEIYPYELKSKIEVAADIVQLILKMELPDRV